MKFFTLLLVAALPCAALVAGCHSNSRQISLLPAVPSGVQPARVFVLKGPIYLGVIKPHPLYLDAKLITRICSGDYAIFAVSPGRHKIAAATPKGWWYGSRILECAAGEDYYFWVGGNTMSELSISKAEEWTKKLHFFESKGE